MTKNKTIYRILLLSGFILLNLLVLFGIGAVYSYLNTGADKQSIFQGDLEEQLVYLPSVDWHLEALEGRTMEKATLEEIEKDYMLSWYLRNRALQSFNPVGIEDLYTQQARADLLALIRYNHSKGISIESTTLEHDIHLNFYSTDGTIISFTDRSVKAYSRIFEQDNLIYESTSLSGYHVVMVLQDGFWRIRHLERFSESQISTEPSSEIPLPADIKGVNYYPKEAPWNTFGDQITGEVYERDFRLIKELGLNTVRVFIGYDDFGKEAVIQEKLEKLDRLLDAASKSKLKVIITLFDFYGDYSMADWTFTQSHARQLVNFAKDHPALLGWDVKNEPDLDFESRGFNEVTSWLYQTIELVRSLDPNHPVTIGWSSPGVAALNETQVDYVSFHYYGDLAQLETSIQLLKQKTKKPVVLQEFGMPTDRGLWNLFGNDSEDQREYYQQFGDVLNRNQINYLFWTLYDFEDIPNRVAGQLPWRKNKQRYFGIIDNTGVPKAAFEAINEFSKQ